MGHSQLCLGCLVILPSGEHEHHFLGQGPTPGLSLKTRVELNLPAHEWGQGLGREEGKEHDTEHARRGEREKEKRKAEKG